jgi:phosphotransferase system  glucose/maltose/N-acetylglucosamine-specific IIC component
MRLQGWVDPVVALVVAALALVLWGAVRGQLRRRGALVVEMAGMAGMVGLTAIALAAVSVDPDLDRHIIAAGWFG